MPAPFRFRVPLLFAACVPILSAQEAAFSAEIRPLLSRYCLTCHSAAKHAGDLNLERFTAFRDVTKDPRPWQKVVEQLTLGEMPPKGMPQPAPAERARLLSWTQEALKSAARARAGDPGPVVLRRLNNSEYTFTIRDLTGVNTLDPAREFPADGAAGEGFLNTGNALAMSPSLVTKYLDAGKQIAAHAVLLPDGIRFSRSTSRRDWTDDALAEIRAFYQKYTEAGGADTVTQQGIALDKNRGGTLPLKRYLTASLAPQTAPKDLSPKYLHALVALMKGTRPSPLLDGLRAKWRTAKPGDVDGMVEQIARWQAALWKFSSVGHIGKVDGPKAWMEPVNPVVAKQEFRVKLAKPTVYLAAYDAGDGAAGDFVVWREPKLLMPGRDPVLLRDLRGFVSQLTARRTRVLAVTAASLNSAAGTSEEQRAWSDFLALAGPANPKLSLLTKKIEKTGEFEFVKGWGSSQLPMVIANGSDQHVRVPGNMKAHAVAVHPSQALEVVVGWRSPVAAAVRVDGVITRAHAECGNGVTWALELRRGRTRRSLAEGEARNAQPVALGPFDRVPVQPGDLLSVRIGPREGNHSCDLTDVDLRISGGGRQWSLSGDVSGNPLAGNPHGGLWHFYTEPVGEAPSEAVIPRDSLLARWLAVEDAAEKRKLAEALQALLASAAPVSGPDAALHRQLTSLASPLFAGAVPSTAKGDGAWGLEPGMFDAGGNVAARAPSVIEVKLPADLAANSEFVTTGALDPARGAEGSVQLEVLTTKPEPRTGLLLTGTTIGDAKGTWSSNNQVVTYGMPVVANDGSGARKRVEAAFEEFRMMFPSSLCYTKIVPVDEVVTLTLFHREDEHLSRLILNEKEKAKLDRLWDELHYVSRDALTLVDAFEQLWQFATQDADPSKFEPLRKPIQARAAAFRTLLLETEPRHVQAVLDFADRAYRRPLTEPEKAQLRAFYAQLRRQELAHEEAVRLMIARVLVAPAFLYRAENAGPAKAAVPVNDFELANRLSYFVWASMPDAELRAAAAAGKLRTAAGLQAQTKRLLRDDRARRLATEFAASWLHLRDFESLDEKSERHFPEFRDLRGPMYEETVRFFEDLFRNNGSVLSILDSDYTFVNGALAKFYRIPGVPGEDWRRVEGIKQYSRGGVLGQASVLAKQSGASRTSPILRGNWISEVLLGDKLPRPPKDVPQLPADEAGLTLSVRELVEKHTQDPRCSSCHVRIDPFGYTLESFDAIGRWRDKDANNKPIHDRSKLKDGTEVQGFAGLREYLSTKGRAAFVHQFCRKLLGYALGRAVQLSDEPLLETMKAQLAANGYHVGSAIDQIVASRQFREIRGRNYDQDE